MPPPLRPTDGRSGEQPPVNNDADQSQKTQKARHKQKSVGATEAPKSTSLSKERHNLQHQKTLENYKVDATELTFQDKHRQSRQLKNPVIELNAIPFLQAPSAEKAQFSADLKLAGETRQTNDVIMDLKSIDSVIATQRKLRKRLGRNPRILCLTDLQQTLTRDTSTLPDSTEKMLRKIQKLLAYNSSISSRSKKLFDVLILPRNVDAKENSSGQSSDSSKLHPQLIEALAQDPSIPVLITTREIREGEPVPSSAAKQPDSSRSSVLLQTLRLLKPEEVHVADIGKRRNSSHTTSDIARMKDMDYQKVNDLPALAEKRSIDMADAIKAVRPRKTKRKRVTRQQQKSLSPEEISEKAFADFRASFQQARAKIGSGASYTQNEQQLDAVLKLIVQAQCSPLLSQSDELMGTLKEGEAIVFSEYEILAQERLETERKNNKKSGFKPPSRADILKKKSLFIKNQAHLANKSPHGSSKQLIMLELMKILDQFNKEPSAQTAPWLEKHSLELKNYFQNLGS